MRKIAEIEAIANDLREKIRHISCDWNRWGRIWVRER